MVIFERSNVEECYSVKKNCGTNLSGGVQFFQDVVLYVLLLKEGVKSRLIFEEKNFFSNLKNDLYGGNFMREIDSAHF